VDRLRRPVGRGSSDDARTKRPDARRACCRSPKSPAWTRETVTIRLPRHECGARGRARAPRRDALAPTRGAGTLAKPVRIQLDGAGQRGAVHFRGPGRPYGGGGRGPSGSRRCGAQDPSPQRRRRCVRFGVVRIACYLFSARGNFRRMADLSNLLQFGAADAVPVVGDPVHSWPQADGDLPRRVAGLSRPPPTVGARSAPSRSTPRRSRRGMWKCSRISCLAAVSQAQQRAAGAVPGGGEESSPSGIAVPVSAAAIIRRVGHRRSRDGAGEAPRDRTEDGTGGSRFYLLKQPVETATRAWRRRSRTVPRGRVTACGGVRHTHR